MRGCKPGVWKNKTKQMEIKGGAAMARRPVTSSAARTRRGTDFGGSCDIDFEKFQCWIAIASWLT
jgi:hypothetical protein